jgi:hypothetical protein
MLRAAIKERFATKWELVYGDGYYSPQNNVYEEAYATPEWALSFSFDKYFHKYPSLYGASIELYNADISPCCAICGGDTGISYFDKHVLVDILYGKTYYCFKCMKKATRVRNAAWVSGITDAKDLEIIFLAKMLSPKVIVPSLFRAGTS